MTQKAVFVSGAGRGIGRNIAERFAKEGYLVGAYTRSGHFDWGQHDPNVIQGKMDVSDPEDFKRAIEDFMKHTGGRLDILVNNAGVAVIGEFEKQEFKDEKRLFDVNVMGCINGIHAALPYLKTTPGAQIDLGTDAVARTEEALVPYTGGQRLYGQVEGDLLWTFDRATVDAPLQPYMWARLKRS